MVRVITRDVPAAARERYDVVVIGGGIHGAAALLDATRRGARALLVERDDFGCGTSWNSLRIVHGGLRYLQTADLARFRESVRERAWLARAFPELVAPLPCLLPLDGRGARRPLVLRAALAANAALTRLVSGKGPFSAWRVLSESGARRAASLLPGGRLAGAALWHDGHVPDSHRLVIEMLHWACAGGARALNRVSAEQLVVEGGAVRGVTVHDRLLEQAITIDTDRVLVCAGWNSASLAGRFDAVAPPLDPPSLAFNVLLDRDPPFEGGLAAPSASGPDGTSFLVPFKGRLLAGTRHAPAAPGDPSAPPEPALVAAYVDELNAALPGLDAAPEDVLRVFHGVLPVEREGSTALTSRPRIVDHAGHGGPRGLVTLDGIKLTTARATAARALDLLLPEVRDAASRLPERPAPRHPPPSRRFLALLAREPRSATTLVRLLAETESALSVDDLLLRRTDWGLLPADERQIRRFVESTGVFGQG